MGQRFLGIDIGTYNVKIADIIVDKESVTISKPVVLRTPRFLVQNGRIADREEFAGLLKNATAEKSYNLKKAVVVLNDSMVITRDRELPAARLKELEQMVKLDASEFLPLDISEYTIRYKVLLPSKENPKKTNYILMSSIKNDILTDFCEVLRDAGIKPVAIDTTINGMIKYIKRSFSSLKAENGKTIVFIDFGASLAKIVIMQDGILAYQHILNHSSQKMDIMLSTGLNIEREQAEEYKIEYGMGHLKEITRDDMAKNVGNIINNQVDIILADVYKHIQNYVSRSGGKAVDSILLTGGMAGMKGLSQYIHESFNIPCGVAALNEAVNFGLDEGQNQKLEESAFAGLFPLFSNIAGAACRGE